MKRLIILFGMCMPGTVGFSQQTLTSERKATVTQATNPTEEVLQNSETDSITKLYSSSRVMKIEVVPVSTENQAPVKQPEKTISSAKKPD